MMRRSRTRRRRTEIPHGRILSGIAIVALGLGTVAFGVRAGSGVPGLPYGTLYVSAPDVGNLKPSDEVRVAGVRVGRIADVETERTSTKVRLQLDPGTGPFAADTTVLVRARGLLGARYLELRPGRSSKVLPDGATLRAKDAVTLGVPDLLDTFDDETRNRLGDMIGGLGSGMLGRGEELNDAIRVGPGAQMNFEKTAAALLRRPGAVRRLIPSLEQGMTAFDRATGDGVPGLKPAADTLRHFVDRRADVRATLSQLPPTLDAADSGLQEGRKLLHAVRAVSTSLTTTLDDAPAGLRSATALLRASPRPLARTATMLKAAGPAVPAALDVTSELAPVLDPLERAFDDLNRITERLGPHSCDIVNFADNWRSTLGYGTSSGGEIGPLNTFRLSVIADAQTTSSGFGPAPSSLISDRDVYTPPCSHSPGSTYSHTGLDTGGKPK